MKKADILLPVKAKHFENVNFYSPCYCEVARAAKEYFRLKKGVKEMANEIFIHGKRFSHETYGESDHDRNMYKAEALNYDDTVLFTLKLTTTQ